MEFILLTSLEGDEPDDLLLNVSTILSAQRSKDDNYTLIVTCENNKTLGKKITYKVIERPEYIYQECKKMKSE